MFCNEKNESVKDDFNKAINTLYKNENILFEFYFKQLDTRKSNIKLDTNRLAHNLYYTNGPTVSLDFDLNVTEVSISCINYN